MPQPITASNNPPSSMPTTGFPVAARDLMLVMCLTVRVVARDILGTRGPTKIWVFGQRPPLKGLPPLIKQAVKTDVPPQREKGRHLPQRAVNTD